MLKNNKTQWVLFQTDWGGRKKKEEKRKKIDDRRKKLGPLTCAIKPVIQELYKSYTTVSYQKGNDNGRQQEECVFYRRLFLRC